MPCVKKCSLKLSSKASDLPWITTDSGNGLVMSGSKPLAELIWTIYGPHEADIFIVWPLQKYLKIVVSVQNVRKLWYWLFKILTSIIQKRKTTLVWRLIVKYVKLIVSLWWYSLTALSGTNILWDWFYQKLINDITRACPVLYKAQNAYSFNQIKVITDTLGLHWIVKVQHKQLGFRFLDINQTNIVLTKTDIKWICKWQYIKTMNNAGLYIFC